MKKLLILLLFLFLLSSPAFADVVWPSMYICVGMASIKVIILGLIVELFFVKFFSKADWIKSAITTVVMNIASCLLGYIPILLSGLLAEVMLFGFNTFHWTHWLLSYLFAIAINTLLEGLIIKFILKLKFTDVISWLFVANVISVLLCVIFFGLRLDVRL